MEVVYRKRVPRERTKAIAYDALWPRPDGGLQEKTLADAVRDGCSDQPPQMQTLP